MLESARRPLTVAERRLLRAKLRSLEARIRRLPGSVLLIAGVVFVALWLWTLVASDAPRVVVSAFWLVAGGAITLWVRRDMRGDQREMEAMARGLESALRRSAADVYDIRANAFAELAEIEDEGACYAFELDGGRIVFITGQEFYESAGFPSLDFSLVYVLGERGETVDMLIDKRGRKATAARTISADVKRTLDVPDHLQVLDGTIGGLEAAVALFTQRSESSAGGRPSSSDRAHGRDGR